MRRLHQHLPDTAVAMGEREGICKIRHKWGSVDLPETVTTDSRIDFFKQVETYGTTVTVKQHAGINMHTVELPQTTRDVQE